MAVEPITVVYKRVPQSGGQPLEIPLDVYLPRRSEHAKAPPPIPLVWVHTGGFLQGSRKFLPQHFIRACDRLNLALITPDYRLAPQVSMLDVVQDVVDSIRFTLSPDKLSAELRANDGGHAIDPSRYILAGSSAGGWVSLLVGLKLTSVVNIDLPTPLAVIAIYPITTIVQERAPYFYKPLKPLPFAYTPTANVGDEIPVEGLRQHMDPQGPVLTEAPVAVLTSRAPLYSYSRQEGTYAKLILGGDDRITAQDVCVPSLLNKRRSAAADETKSNEVPKLVFIATGDADVHVEPDQSEQAIEALKASRAPFELATHVEPGKGHLWDIFDSTADIPLLWSKVESVLP